MKLMIPDEPYTIAAVALGMIIAGALFGWLMARLRYQQHITRLETTLMLEKELAERQHETIEQTFAAISAQALKSNNQAFLDLAQESLKQFHIQARGDLEQKEKSIETLVRPIKDALSKTEQQLQTLEKERRESYGALHKHLETLTQTQQQLHDQTRNLVQALRRPEVRGQWGELTLKRLVELAGMLEHCDFYTQENTDSGSGRLRPDMVIRMPAGREIVVDVKTPLDAYLSAVEADNDDDRKKFLLQHCRNVRERVRELAAKNYWQQFKNSPDFVVLFIPGDQFLNAALDLDRDLLEHALGQKIILSTPTSLVALLRAIAFGWRQEKLTENAELIRTTGESLFKRLVIFSEHLGKVGRSLDSAVSSFNKAVGSFDSKLIPGARRLTELGLGKDKPVEEPEKVEKSAREIERREGYH